MRIKRDLDKRRAMAISQDAYNEQCRRQNCITPMSKRVCKFLYSIKENFDNRGEFAILAPDQVHVDKNVLDPDDRIGWIDYKKADMDKFEPEFEIDGITRRPRVMDIR